MALNLDERYPGRANPKNLDYPQGSFKNRTSPTSQDGTYLEQDWANDQLAFFQALLVAAGITPNGQVDTAQASQYFDALGSIISDATPDASESNKGLIQIATSLVAQGLSDDTMALTPKKLSDAFKGSNQLLSANGLQKHPGGLIEQWGEASVADTGTLITFPLAFPNACLNIMMTDRGASGQASYACAIQGTPSKTSFVGQSTFAGMNTIFWRAIGH